MFFLHDVVKPSNLAAADSQNASSDGESFYDEDNDDFGSVSSGELEDQMDVDDPGHRPGDDQPSEAPPAPSASGPSHDSDPSDSPPSLTPTATQDTNTNDDGNTPQDTPKPPKGKSIAHYNLKAKRVVFVSLDVETGGEYCGIIQLSAELFRKKILVQQSTVSQRHSISTSDLQMAPYGTRRPALPLMASLPSRDRSKMEGHLSLCGFSSVTGYRVTSAKMRSASL